MKLDDSDHEANKMCNQLHGHSNKVNKLKSQIQERYYNIDGQKASE